jgi:hypothetical protein
MIAQIVAAAWETATLGDAAVWLGVAGAGGTSVVVARVLVRALTATTRALTVWTRHLEDSATAARAEARLAPLKAEALRAQIRRDGGKPPAEPEDSDELQALRAAAEGDEGELARLVELLAGSDPESTLNRKLSKTEQRLVELLREAQRRRIKSRDADAPRPRGRTPSWLERRRTAAKAQA